MSFDEIIETASEELVEEHQTEVAEESTEKSVEAAAVETAEETSEETSEETNEETEPDASDIAYLKAELDSLKKELSDTRAFYSRLEGECAEFSALYPEVPLGSLPDSIWLSVKNGVPLAAAYALEARKSELSAIRAQRINGENRNMSSGALNADSHNDYFSPSEVRAMSAAEVRANYTKIINSMSKWH